MKSTRFRNMMGRVARTFMQTAIPVFLVTALGPLQRVWADVINWLSGTGNVDTSNVNALRAAMVAVLSAGIVSCVSLGWNVLNSYFKIGNNWGIFGTPQDTEIGQKVLDPKDDSTAVIDGKKIG